MKNSKILYLFLLLTLLCSCQKEEEEPIVYNVDKALLLKLVNEQRAAGCRCGAAEMSPVPPLAWNNLLAEAAYLHSLDMYSQNYFSHTGLDGRSHSDRIKATGYKPTSSGENIAMGYPDEKAVVQGWMNSEGHCKNIMNKNFTEIGIGRENSYWTMALAKPAK